MKTLRVSSYCFTRQTFALLKSIRKIHSVGYKHHLTFFSFTCNLVAQPISQLTASDTYGASRYDIHPMMPVTSHSVISCICSHGITTDTHPLAGMSIFFMEDGGVGKGQGGMSGGEGVMVASIWPHTMHCMFQTMSNPRRQGEGRETIDCYPFP